LPLAIECEVLQVFNFPLPYKDLSRQKSEMNKRLILIGACFLLISAALFAQPKHKAPVPYSYSCFQNPDQTWGYDILSSGKLFIHQPTVPAIQGNHGFAGKSSAEKVARLAIKKLKEKPNEFPTVTIEELEELKVKTK
jgi:hypothetical protein